MMSNRRRADLYRGALVLTCALILVLLPSPASADPPEGPNQPSAKSECMNAGWQNYPHAGFRNQGDCIRFVVTGVFSCRDALGCVSYEEDDSLRMATALAISGEVASLGVDSQRGVEIALAQRGPVFGHGLALRAEDDGCSPEAGETAADAIVSDPSVLAVVGTSCSSAARVAAPILSDAGYSMVSPSNTGPDLTDPASHPAGYLRVSWNDRDQGVAMAEFLWSEGVENSAVVVDGSAYSAGLADAFVDRFESLGGSITTYETAEADGSNASNVIAAVVAAGAPGALYLPVFEPPASALITEARLAPELAETLLAGSDVLFSQDIVDGLGDDAEGILFTGPDLSFMETTEYQDFADTYLSQFGESPLTWFSPFAYDAANIIVNAAEAVAVVDGEGTLHIGRQALRGALFATSGFDGLTGTITCNSVGDCAGVGLVVYTVVGGEIVVAP